MFSRWVFRILKYNLQLLSSLVTHSFNYSPSLHWLLQIQSTNSPNYNSYVGVIHTTFSIKVLPRDHIPLITREEVTRIESKCSD